MILGINGILARKGGGSLMLDIYTGAAAAYSLRKLRTAYSGNAITVRRSFDNTSQNIGFDVNGNLDTASLLSFVGSNNQALYSEEFDNVNWNKYITTVTSNQAIAPDGTMTADLLAESTANNYHTLYNGNNIQFAVGTSWNMSLYVKKGPGTSAPDTIILGFPSATGNIFSHPCVLFNISSGTVLDSLNASNDSNFGSSIVDAGNGWWRCSVWGTVTVVGNRFQHGVVRFNNNLNTINTSLYPGNVQSNVYIWGWQFQKALNDTSVLTTQPYTKTTATANAGNGFVSVWFDQSGTGNNMLQPTPALQPQIVNSGSLITVNSKPSVYINTTQLSANRIFSNSNFSIFCIAKAPAGTSTSTTILAQHDGTAALNRTVFIQRDESSSPYNKLKTFYNDGTSKSLLSSGVVFDDTLKILNVNSNGSGQTTQYINDTLGGTLNSTAWNPLNTPTTLGKYGTTVFNGYVSELICYTSIQSTNYTGINTNINSFYSIY